MHDERENLTPAFCMSDEDYKACVVANYGHIKGLARALLAIRKNEAESSADRKETKRRVSREDIAVYCQIRKEIDTARKLLNKLHVRLSYTQKEKNYTDLLYEEIHSAVSQVKEMLSQTEARFILPQVKKQRQEMMLDYIEYITESKIGD